MPSHLSAAEIKTQGTVFTPPWVVRAMLDRAGLSPERLWASRVLDPAAGDGAFGVELVARLVAGGRARGAREAEIVERLTSQLLQLELDPVNAHACRMRLTAAAERAGIRVAPEGWTVRVADSTDPSVLAPWIGTCDAVVGNPPYVRIQHLGAERRARLRAEWPLTRQGSSDLYHAFYELGLRCCRPGGLLAYVAPNSFFQSAAGAPLRAHLAGAHRVREIIDFKHHQIFTGATAYAAIVIVEAGGPGAPAARPPATATATATSADTALAHPEAGVAPALAPPGGTFWYRAPSAADVAAERLGPVEACPLSTLSPSGRWILTSATTALALRQRAAGATPLGELVRISTGLATLADRVYIHALPGHAAARAAARAGTGALPATVDLAVTLKDGDPPSVFPVEPGILRPIVKVSTLKADAQGVPVPQDLWIVFPYEVQHGRMAVLSEDVLAARYPRALAFLRAVRPLLDARDKGRPNPVAWYAFGRSQGLDSTFGEKLFTAPFNRSPSFIHWTDPAATFYSGYALTSRPASPVDLGVLRPALNSTAMAEYIAATSKDYQHGWKSYAKAYITDFPVPAALAARARRAPDGTPGPVTPVAPTEG